MIRKFWNLFILFSIYYCSTYGIFRNTFYPHDIQSFFFYFEILIDLSFILDIFIQFFTPYYENNTVYYDKKTIALNYIRNWFFWDFISSIPLNILLYINYILLKKKLENGNINDNDNKFYIENYEFFQKENLKNYIYILQENIFNKLISNNFYFHFLNWLRTIKLFKVFSHDKNTNLTNEFNISSKYKSSSYLRLSLIFLFLTHISSCIWVCIGGLDNSKIIISWFKTINNYWKMDAFDIYISSLYFNLLTIYTVGYGDITSKNNNERLYNIFILVVGNLLFSFGISYLSFLFASSNILENKFKQKLKILDKIRKKYDVPKNLYRQIKRSIKNMYTKVHLEKFIIYDSLPLVLKRDFILSMHKKGISNLIFFKFSDKEFIINVLPLLKTHNLLKDDILVSAGGIMEEIYLVNHGILSICMDTSFNSIQISQLKRNFHFGDILIYLNEKSPYSLKCLTKSSEYLTLTKTDYYKIGLTFDKILMKILEISCEFLENIEKIKQVIIALFDNGKTSYEIKILINIINNFILKMDFDNLFYNSNGADLLTVEDFFAYNDIKDIIKFSHTNMDEKNFKLIFDKFLMEEKYNLDSYGKMNTKSSHPVNSNLENDQENDEDFFISDGYSSMDDSSSSPNMNKNLNENSIIQKTNITRKSRIENNFNNSRILNPINSSNISIKGGKNLFSKSNTRKNPIRRGSNFYRDRLQNIGNKLKSSDKLPTMSEHVTFFFDKNLLDINGTKIINPQNINMGKNSIKPNQNYIRADNRFDQEEKQIVFNELNFKEEEKNLEKKVLNMGKFLLGNVDKQKSKFINNNSNLNNKINMNLNKNTKILNNDLESIIEDNLHKDCESSFSETEQTPNEIPNFNRNKNIQSNEISSNECSRKQILKESNNYNEEGIINNKNIIKKRTNKPPVNTDARDSFKKEERRCNNSKIYKNKNVNTLKNKKILNQNNYVKISESLSNILKDTELNQEKNLVSNTTFKQKLNLAHTNTKDHQNIVKTTLGNIGKINITTEPRTFDDYKNFILDNIEKKKRYYNVVNNFKNFLKNIIEEYQFLKNNKKSKSIFINQNNNIINIKDSNSAVFQNIKEEIEDVQNNHILNSYNNSYRDNNKKEKKKDSFSYRELKNKLKRNKRCVSLNENKNILYRTKRNKFNKKNYKNSKEDQNLNNNYENLIGIPIVETEENFSFENSMIKICKSLSIDTKPNRIASQVKKIVNENLNFQKFKERFSSKEKKNQICIKQKTLEGKLQVMKEKGLINEKKEENQKINSTTQLTEINDNTFIKNFDNKKEKIVSNDNNNITTKDLIGDSSIFSNKEKSNNLKKDPMERIFVFNQIDNLPIKKKEIENEIEIISTKQDSSFNHEKMKKAKKSRSLKKKRNISDFLYATDEIAQNEIKKVNNSKKFKSNNNLIKINQSKNEQIIINKQDNIKKSISFQNNARELLTRKNIKFSFQDLNPERVYSYEILNGNLFFDNQIINKNNIFSLENKNIIIPQNCSNSKDYNYSYFENQDLVEKNALNENRINRNFENIKNSRNKAKSKLHQSLINFKKLEFSNFHNFKGKNSGLRKNDDSINKKNLKNSVINNNINNMFDNIDGQIDKNHNNKESRIRNKFQTKLFLKDQLKNLFSTDIICNNQISTNINKNTNNNIVNINIKNKQQNTNYITVINNNNIDFKNLGQNVDNYNINKNFKQKINTNFPISPNNNINGFHFNKNFINKESNLNSKEKAQKIPEIKNSIDKNANEASGNNIFDDLKNMLNKKVKEIKETQMINKYALFDDSFLANINEDENSLLEMKSDVFSSPNRKIKNIDVQKNSSNKKRNKDEEDKINVRMDNLLKLFEKNKKP